MLVENHHIVINMDMLTQHVAGMALARNDWFDNSDIGLYVRDNRVFTSAYICQGQFIGEILGSKKYVWDVPQDSYCVALDDTLCIDCNEAPRCITSMIRKGTERYNCTLAFSFKDDTVDAYIIATESIHIGEELVVKYERLNDYC